MTLTPAGRSGGLFVERLLERPQPYLGWFALAAACWILESHLRNQLSLRQRNAVKGLRLEE